LPVEGLLPRLGAFVQIGSYPGKPRNLRSRGLVGAVLRARCGHTARKGKKQDDQQAKTPVIGLVAVRQRGYSGKSCRVMCEPLSSAGCWRGYVPHISMGECRVTKPWPNPASRRQPAECPARSAARGETIPHGAQDDHGRRCTWVDMP
jgi:hypothetical protein